MAQSLKKWVWVLLVSLLLLGIPVIFLKSNLLTIANVSCKTQYGPCENTDSGKLAQFYGQNLFSVSGREIMAKMKEDFQNRNVSVQKVFPRTLAVLLDKRKALVAVREDGLENGAFLVDSDGIVIGFVKKSSLPSLTLWKDANLVVGESVERKIKQVARILFTTNRIQQGTVGDYKNQKDDFFRVFLPSNVEVYYPFGRDPEVLIGALQLILTRSRIDGKIPKLIDLRYSNPVLRY